MALLIACRYVVSDSLTDLAHVNSMSMFQDFLINSLPYVLFPNCLLGPLALLLCSNETGTLMTADETADDHSLL
jgi:hypothetical protein